eukprot:5694189-Pyramimonas_sp.AAC.1
MQSPEGYAYVSNQGTRHRIDYVAAAPSMMARLAHCRVETEFDTGQASKDHFPLFATFSWQVEKRHGSSKGPPKLDPRKLECPVACEKFRQTLTSIELNPWDQ